MKKISYWIVLLNILLIQPLFSQNLTITGTVIGASDDIPLPGVTIFVKGTTQGTVTDLNGYYSIEVSDNNAILMFSYVGYAEREISLDGRIMLDIILKESFEQLDEVVVIGYGTTETRKVTGSIAVVKAERVENLPVPNISEGLTGQVAGLRVVQSNGAPGSTPSLQIRGIASVGAGAQPLYVIDGFPGGDINSIDPSSIESIQVLKDAASTAIYGSRAGNGVVIITTKKGSQGKSIIEFNAFGGPSEPVRYYDMLNPDEYIDFWNHNNYNGWLEGSQNEPWIAPLGFDDPDGWQGPRTDWQREIFNKGSNQKYNLSFSGASEKTNYRLSGSYLAQDGIAINSGFRKYTADANINANVSSNLRVGSTFNVYWSHTDETRPNILREMLKAMPIFPPYDEEGEYVFPNEFMNGAYSGWAAKVNPINITQERIENSNRLSLMGNAFVEIDILQDLKFRSTISSNFTNSEINLFNPSTARDWSDRSYETVRVYGQYTNSEYNKVSNENFFSYFKKFGEKHDVNIIAGYSWEIINMNRAFMEADNYSSDFVQTLNAGTVQTGETTKEKSTLLSVHTRLQYSFKERYLASFSFRRDGSSRFGNENKWGNFPSASLGWVLSDESFMKSLGFLSNLKLKASWGVNGNYNIPYYAHIGLLDYDYYVLGNKRVNAISPSTMTNSALGWENTIQYNAGIDIGLLDNRIILLGEVYHKLTSDLLLDVQIPSVTGYGSVMRNVGEVENKGWEFTLTTRNFTGDFRWTTDINISHNQNTVKSLGSDDRPLLATIGTWDLTKTEVGYPLSQFFGYKVLGVWNTWEEIEANPHRVNDKPGEYRHWDANGDGEITPDDQTLIGDPEPDFVFGLTNSFNYKNFDFSFLMQGSYGNEIFNMRLVRIANNKLSESNHIREALEGAWVSAEQTPNAKWPSLNDRGEWSYRYENNSNYVEDGSFLRCRYATLGYSVPKNLLSKVRIDYLRLYFTVQNPFILTRYRGFDPEEAMDYSPIQQGIAYWSGYPVSRTYSFGITLRF